MRAEPDHAFRPGGVGLGAGPATTGAEVLMHIGVGPEAASAPGVVGVGGDPLGRPAALTAADQESAS